MGTTSEKLTYLNTTKEKIKDSINLTGANLTSEDTFRSYASKLKKGYIDIINNGIDTLYNNFPKVSGIGSNLSLTPTYEAPMKLNEIQGSTLQNGTPTPDTPVEIENVTGLQNINVCGKNLLNIPNGTYSHNGITAVINNGEITLNGTASATSFIVITLLKEIVAENQTLTISNNNQENISDNLTELRLLTTVGDYIPCSFKQINNSTTRTNLTGTYNRLQIRTSSGVSFNNFIIKPQLEQGSATSYEPYKGNTYEVNLGKNLFDKDNANILNAYINSNGNSSDYKKIISNNNSRTIYISCKSNTTYTVSKIAGQRFVVASCNNVPEVNVLCTNEVHDQTGVSLTITTGANDKYLVVFYYLSTANTPTEEQIRNSIQIEVGNQATSYSPYFTPIELNKIGDYKDSIKKSNGKNLFDGVVAQGEFNILGNINTTTIRNYSVNYIPVIPNENYVSNYNINRMCFYDKNKTFINRSSNYNFATFTIPSNAYYIRFDISTDYNASTMQIEKGTQASSYEPYGKVWYVEKNIGKVVLDISLSSVGSTNFSNVYQIYANVMNISYLMGGYCDNFKFNDDRRITDNNNANSWLSNNQCALRLGNESARDRFYVKSTNFASANELKAYFNTNPTTLYYVLATPTYTEITNTELIEDLETLYTAKSQDGTTNISITSEDLEMILNVSALKGDVE